MKRVLSFLALCLILVFQSQAQDDKSLLWKITGPDSDEVSYLFGTYHLVGSDYLKEHSKVEKAYLSANTIVVETVLDTAAMQMIAMKGMMLDQSLKDLVDSADYALLKENLEPVIGVSLAVLDHFKPSYISAMYAMQLAAMNTPSKLKFGGDPIDMFFAKNGTDRNKVVVSLETPAEQAEILFESQTLDEQAEGLVELAEDKEAVLDMTEIIVEAYLKEDLQIMLDQTLEQEDSVEEMAVMLDNRNTKWISTLKTQINLGSTFIAVGALHLPGEKGLIKLLQKEGYTIEPVQ